MRRTSRRILAATVSVGLMLAACSSDEPTSDASEEISGSESASEVTDEGTDDTVAFEGTPPTELVVEQVAPPTSEDSPAAAAGDVVLVHYEGRSWSTGEIFDSSLSRDPIEFTLGTGAVIPGWDQGIAGLRVGEKARLIIPPDLAYGPAGIPGVIAENETLVFDVELVEIADS